MKDSSGSVFLTGVTGFVGGKLVRRLLAHGCRVRCLVRSNRARKEPLPPGVEIVEGDLLRGETLSGMCDGTSAAFYLVHSMGGRKLSEIRSFAVRDQLAARNFLAEAERSGVSRILYLGGLGETGDDLSEHLASRRMVGEILRDGRPRTTILRAANIIGAGGAPFEMLRYIVERLPVMICPRWIDTLCQPIAIENVLDYLVGCLDSRETAGESFDIGGPEILTYRALMLLYARIRGLRRAIFTVPVLTPRLSSHWINLVTPVPAGVVMPLVEGLKNVVVCRETRIRELVPTRLIPMEEAIRSALQAEKRGPGSRDSFRLRAGGAA